MTRRRQGRATVYFHMLRRWSAMAAGTSYWHHDQGPGRAFRPGRLHGYFNDLTAKTGWPGALDAAGVPYHPLDDEAPLYFPTTIFQKALGHWDAWLLTGRRDEAELATFMRLAAWALAHQDDRGGWAVWPLLGWPMASPYSAMTQGEGASVLARAEAASGDRRYATAARRALALMLMDVEDGGTARRGPDGLVLEEEPTPEPSAILNGWVFALYGLHDYVVMRPDATMAIALEGTAAALAAALPRYDAGFWSCYDQAGRLASPFYHRLHCAQLTALEATFPGHAPMFRATRERFEAYQASRWRATLAVAWKAGQKLARPPRSVIG